MKLELVEVYEYNELSVDAKNKVLNRERESMSYDTWWIDDLKMIFVDMLSEKGIKSYPTDEIGIAFSLSYCQGDCVGFFGGLDTEELFSGNKEFKDSFPILLQLIKDYNETEPNYHTSLHDEITININQSRRNVTIMYVDADIVDVDEMIGVVNESGKFLQYYGYGIEQERTEFESYLQEWFDDIAFEFERIGYADIEARESEESIVENLECNDIRFLKNGYQIDWAIVSEEDLKHM